MSLRLNVRLHIGSTHITKAILLLLDRSSLHLSENPEHDSKTKSLGGESAFEDVVFHFWVKIVKCCIWL
jgi:hypothetical protein